MIEIHNGIEVIRDDLYPGGTKARYLHKLFQQYDEVVYASPVCGGAQIALATVAAAYGKQATIFCAQRANHHPRTKQAKGLGAKIIEISPGYLSVIKSRAKNYCQDRGAFLAPFGLDIKEAIEIAKAAAEHSPECPDEVWCAGGSGTLCRGLQTAWPQAEHYVVEVGRSLSVINVGSARIHSAPYKFEQPCRLLPPFPCDLHYEAKAWEICINHQINASKRIVFWNVLGQSNA